MRLMQTLLVSILFLFLLNSTTVFAEFKAKNVVVVVGDQFRHDDSFGDRTHQYIPRIWNDLVPEGSLCVTFYGNPSFMALVHLAVLTGSWKDVRRLKPQDFPDQPTMFEYYRKQQKKDKESCYFITSKPEFNYMSYSNHEEFGEEFGATVEFTKQPNNDEELFQKLTAYMKSKHPPLIFVILGGIKGYNKAKRPDEVALTRKQMKEMDNTVYRIWNAVQSDDTYKDKTDFFFLNDHGDLITHEDCDDECKRYLVMLAIGPDFKKKYTSENKWRQVNICATVGAILNFPTPYVAKEGTVMTDILLDYKGK